MTLTLALLIAASAPRAPVTPIYGMAVAGDGDSLTVGNKSVRLFGIDAPELDQTCSRGSQQWSCGAEAKAYLARLIAGKRLRCTPVSTDQHDRIVARCITRETDLNRAMVESGYAVAFRKYSADYVASEAKAKQAKLGLWSGTFELPQDYRAMLRAQRRSPANAQTTSTHSRPAQPRRGCVIKGNHSRKGHWIYHLPGMPDYEQTRPEAIFCSEAQAQAAGYRRARVR